MSLFADCGVWPSFTRALLLPPDKNLPVGKRWVKLPARVFVCEWRICDCFFSSPCEAWRCSVVFVTVARSVSCTPTVRPGFGKPGRSRGHHYPVTAPSQVRKLQSHVGKCFTGAFYFLMPVASIIVAVARVLIGRGGCELCQTCFRSSDILLSNTRFSAIHPCQAVDLIRPSAFTHSIQKALRVYRFGLKLSCRILAKTRLYVKGNVIVCWHIIPTSERQMV